MGKGDLVAYFLVFSFVGSGYLVPLFSFFFSPIKFVGVFFVGEGCKRMTEGGKKQTKITFRFQLYSWVQQPFCRWEFLPETNGYGHVSQISVEMHLLFSVVDKFKVGIFYNVCFGGVGSLAADMATCEAIKFNQHMCSLLVASWKRVRLVIRWRLKSG